MSRAMLRRIERHFQQGGLGQGTAWFGHGPLTARDAAEDELEQKRENLAAELVKIAVEAHTLTADTTWVGFANEALAVARVVYPDLPAEESA
jgi:hypothetical protein